MVEPTGNILIDCPAWDPVHQPVYHKFLTDQGGVRWLFITHRGGMSQVREIQDAFDCDVLIQEQEAYLLPNLVVKPFQDSFHLSDRCRAIWTPGHSPGSSCLYCDRDGGILFSGRHLLPDRQAHPTPLRVAKTFHWPRQIRSIQQLLNEFNAETLQCICPGANTGFLRGDRVIRQAYQSLAELNLEELLRVKPGF